MTFDAVFFFFFFWLPKYPPFGIRLISLLGHTYMWNLHWRLGNWFERSLSFVVYRLWEGRGSASTMINILVHLELLTYNGGGGESVDKACKIFLWDLPHSLIGKKKKAIHRRHQIELSLSRPQGNLKMPANYWRSLLLEGTRFVACIT